jgi:hypothetical protein
MLTHVKGISNKAGSTGRGGGLYYLPSLNTIPRSAAPNDARQMDKTVKMKLLLAGFSI